MKQQYMTAATAMLMKFTTLLLFWLTPWDQYTVLSNVVSSLRFK